MNTNTKQIQMVDLQSQYQRLKDPINQAIQEVLDSTAFIKGPQLAEFEASLANYLKVKHVIGCANGTDALQIAFMALDLKPGDEVIVPAFTYVATAEVIGLLGLVPIMVDVYSDTFNVNLLELEKAITTKTKAIVPVHLFGQSANMEGILDIATRHNLFVVEDNAQALGANYTNKTGQMSKTGTMGNIGCTSFFPSKNLGCFGDGGALFTNDDSLAEKIKTIANHGQKKKYYHSVLGVNSRLDTLQAAILNVKLKELDDFANRRQLVAERYNQAFTEIQELECPFVATYTDHVYHQYTLKVKNGLRDKLQAFLSDKGVPSMIYYPVPLYEQEAFKSYFKGNKLVNTEDHCKSVLSLPIHTEMEGTQQNYIINSVKSFFNK